ncbi:MAG: LysR substrate-binding domain-containing protein [Paracoccus sp. (in: a-proteobacteria)]
MDLTDGIRAFVAVIETGSFTAAGQRLRVSNKQVSKQIAGLETRLGRSLLYRTTRAVSLTDAGEGYLPHARRILGALEEADAALREPEGVLSGRLRIACGATLGELCVADAVHAFTKAHPLMRVDLHLSDGFTDLAVGGFDLAIRIGIPRDSSLRMQRIGATTPRVAASPAYLQRHGRPDHPGDLAGHHAILDLNAQSPDRWTFRRNGEEQTVTMAGNMAVNSAAVTIRRAMAGDGLVRAPDIFLTPHLASGALVTVLDDFADGTRPIHLLSPPTAFRQKKIAAFAALLRQQLDGLAPAGFRPG